MRLTTRQRILEYIQSKEVATVAEISGALHMTSANARYHLSVLRDEGVLKVIGQRQKGGRGRPVDLYRLTIPIARHSLDKLAHALLTEILDGKAADAQEETLNKLALRLYSPSTAEVKNLSQRLNEAVRYLNCMSYQARWEAHALGPRVIFQHCPYQAIVENHPEMCQLDLILLRNMLSAPVQQAAKLEVTPLGIPQCIFKLG